MKFKFVLLTVLLLFARGCDFYSTSLWFFDNPEYEANPMTSVFGIGWTGLIIANLIIISLVLAAHYYYTFRYSVRTPSTNPKKLTEYVSNVYYNKKNKFYQVLYKPPTNKSVLIAHTGYVMIRAGILGSFIATIHNLLLHYDVPFYERFSRFVGWPEYVVYALIILSIYYFSWILWKKEFQSAKHLYNHRRFNP